MEPHLNNSSDQGDEFEAALEEALGEVPRSTELRRMRELLQERRARLAQDLSVAEDDQARDKLRRELVKLDEQIAVLKEEAEITKFIEDSVRVGLEMRRLDST